VSYAGYVVAAYAVFAAVLAWDWLSPRLQLRRELRAARLRAARGTSRPAPGAPLSRDAEPAP
jgi:heme exporter protein D